MRSQTEYVECLQVERAQRLARQASTWRGYLTRLELLLGGVL